MINFYKFILYLIVYLNILSKSNAILETDENPFEEHLPQDKLLTLIGTFPTSTDKDKDLFDDNNTTDNAYRTLDIYEMNTNKNEEPDEIEQKLDAADNTMTENKIKLIEPTTKLAPLLTLCLETGIHSFTDCLLMILQTDRPKKCVNTDKTSVFVHIKPEFVHSFDTDEKRKDTKTGSSGTPKRIAFHSWGGKRFGQKDNINVQASRLPFSAWGGKRQNHRRQQFITDNKRIYETYKRSKLKFHSWGGKRNLNDQ